MATKYSPKIVTDGLVGLFDPSNRKSYDPNNPGDVINLAQPHLTGSVSGSISHDGNWVLSGMPDAIKIDSTVTENLLTATGGTWEIWVKPVDATIVQNFMSMGDTSGNSDIFFDTLADGTLRASNRDNPTVRWRLQLTTVPSLEDGVWSCIALTHDGVTPILYKDGVAPPQTFLSQDDKTWWLNDMTGLDNGSFGVERFNGGQFFHYNGSIGQVTIYNRALSVGEIYQNYIALRGRYQ